MVLKKDAASKFSEEQIVCTKTLYNELWAGNLPLKPLDVPEFADLSELEEHGVGVYFAHPYSAWERPQNERHNRLFRRYVSKGMSIDKYSAEQILSFADEVNALPRKILGYCTPEERFDEFLYQVYSVDKVRVT